MSIVSPDYPGLQLWLPLNSTSPAAKPGDTYQVRSAYSAGLVLSLNEFGVNEAKPAEVDHAGSAAGSPKFVACVRISRATIIS